MTDQPKPTPVPQPVDPGDGGGETNGHTSQYLRPDELLRRWSIALTNVSDPGILAAMTRFGYDARRNAEGMGLYNKVRDLFARQKKEHGEQLEASAALSKAFSMANTAYMQSIKVARIALEGDANAVSALTLNGPRSRIMSRWLKQAGSFYQNLIANPDFLAKMALYGYTADKLKAEQKLVEDVAAADAKHKIERGESQEATKVRDKSLAELETWMSKFYRIARIACAGQDQWLEKLGVKEV